MMTPTKSIVISACVLAALLALVIASFGRLHSAEPAGDSGPRRPDAVRPVTPPSYPLALQRVMEGTGNAPSPPGHTEVVTIRVG